MKEFDIVIIGGGTAGMVAFGEVTRLGCSAIVVDHGPPGTTCARVGCMPSKAALHAGRQWTDALGVAKLGDGPDSEVAARLWAHARATRDRLTKGAADRAQASAGELLIHSTARFIDSNMVDVGGTPYKARAVIVATGSTPVMPAALAALGDRVLTTDTLFEQVSLPRSLGVIGTGAIGLEMGLAMSRLGVSVTAGDLAALPAGIADPAIGARAVDVFGKELDLWLGHPVEAAIEGAQVRISTGAHSAVVDRVLVALGRRPNTADLGLEQAGASPDAKGQYRVDPTSLRIGSTSIFLAGDVNPDRPLQHEAQDEAVIAARHAVSLVTGVAPTPYRRRTPLSIVFSDPDIASVGAGFAQLERDAYVIGRAEGSANGRSRIMGAESNLLHLYVAKATGRILGAALVCQHGEHLAHLLSWAIQRDETVNSLLEMPFYHPSVEEMVQTALRDAAKHLTLLTVDQAGLIAEPS